MKGVVVAPGVSPLHLPCCVVLIQPQTIQDFLDSQSWDDNLGSFTRPNADPAVLPVPTLPRFDEAFQSAISTADTKARPPQQLTQLGPSVSEPSYGEHSSSSQWPARVGQAPLTASSHTQRNLDWSSPPQKHHSNDQSLIPQTGPHYTETLTNLPHTGKPTSDSAPNLMYQKVVERHGMEMSEVPNKLLFKEPHYSASDGQISILSRGTQSSMPTWSVRNSSQRTSIQSGPALFSVDQSKLSHVHTSPTVSPQSQPRLPSNIWRSAPPRSCPSSERNTMGSEVVMGQNVTNSSSFVSGATSLSPTSCDIPLRVLGSTASGPAATQDQFKSSQNYSLIRGLMSAHPSLFKGHPEPTKRYAEAAPETYQAAKRKRSNYRYFEFRARFMKFLGIALRDHRIMCDVLEELSDQDITSLAIMLRCFEVFTRSKVHRVHALNFLEATVGQLPWVYHWLCYAFSPNGQNCILDNELTQDYVLPAVKPDDVSQEVWAMITDTRKPMCHQAFYKAVYQLHEAWKSNCRRPPPAEEIVLDDAIKTRLRLCERPTCSFETGVVCDRVLGRQWFTAVAARVFYRKPIVDQATRLDDEFYQLMLGVAAVMAIEPCQPSEGHNQTAKFKRMAEELIGFRYRGPNDQSVIHNLVLDSSAVRECVKRGYLKPKLLMSVTSELARSQGDFEERTRKRFILMVLISSASLFLKWSNLHGHASNISN
eukprot:Blabericola_migrator_1__5570@NODE_2836_length_2298_cov_40_643209_g1779_i0_p1_GENE_NODE_2836_length_2298_cov_40_643209_g1779_i0NODE_2836_length_2298_cov_40_643209_g1779_i0_p1_ORF_typecomplete_len708_score58_92_NODE_2836_length_2298_cov_40_643209_g1779_i0812204